MDEEVDPDLMKISKGVYVESEPFKETHLFCKLFALFYWKYDITNVVLSPSEQKTLQAEMMSLNSWGGRVSGLKYKLTKSWVAQRKAQSRAKFSKSGGSFA